MSITEQVAANVRAESSRRSLTQSAMANHLRMSQASLSERLRGRVEFKLSELDALAAYMGLEIEDLLRRNDHHAAPGGER